MPLALGSDNGPAFMATISKSMSHIIGIKWNLHGAYRPQSSGQVERANRTLKEILTKLSLETELCWVELLPFALLSIRCTPKSPLNLSPFQIIYGHTPRLLPHIDIELKEKFSHLRLLKSLRALHEIQPQLQNRVRTSLTLPHENPFQPLPYKSGKLVYIRRFDSKTLEPWWKGPFSVILSTPLAVKVTRHRCRSTDITSSPDWTAAQRCTRNGALSANPGT